MDGPLTPFELEGIVRREILETLNHAIIDNWDLETHSARVRMNKLPKNKEYWIPIMEGFGYELEEDEEFPATMKFTVKPRTGFFSKWCGK